MLRMLKASNGARAFLAVCLLAAVAPMLTCRSSSGGDGDIVTKVSAVTLPTGWADTAPAAVRYQNLGVDSPWENTMVAIPPNTAGCGPDGAVIVSRNNKVEAISKTTLTCAKTGSLCTTTDTKLDHNNHGYVDQFTSSDNDIVRVNAYEKRILVTRMFRRNPGHCFDVPPPPNCNHDPNDPADCCNRDPNDPAAYRGAAAFWKSSNCGASWTEASQLDPHDSGLLDLDHGRLYADPWSSRVFYVVQDTNPVAQADLFISNDGGDTWQAPKKELINTSYWVTTLRSGQAYLFGTDGTAGTGILYKYDPSTGLSSAISLPINPVWDAPVTSDGIAKVIDGRGITRIGQFPDGDYLRILYPTQHGAAIQQDFTVAVVRVAGAPPVATVMEQKVITADPATPLGSILGATFVETDRSELPTAATENTALLYWHETNAAPAMSTKQLTKGALVRDRSSWTGTLALSTFALPAFTSDGGWGQYNNTGASGQGDYRNGAFFYETGTQTLNFLAEWVEWRADAPNGIFSNIARFPQNNLPEEQFSPYDSQGTPPGGGTFVQSPAITAQGSRLDVYAVASNLSIRHKSFASGTWSGWDTVPAGTSSYGLAAVATVSERDLVAVRSNGSMYFARDHVGWSSWTNLGSPPSLLFNAGPAITTWGGGRLDVFGRATDGQLWHAACGSGCTTLGNWSGWEPLGGTLGSGPAAVAWSYGRIDIIALGTDPTLFHKAYDGCCGWTGWEPLGGDFLAEKQLAVSSWAPGRLDLFARGRVDNFVHHKSYDGSYGWSTWLSTNSATATAGIGAVSGGAAKIDHVTIAADGSVWHAANAR